MPYGSTWPTLMQSGLPFWPHGEPPKLFEAFTRFARLAAFRFESVRPWSVGTPLNAPLRASLIRCPW